MLYTKQLLFVCILCVFYALDVMALDQCIKLSPTSGACTSTSVTYKNIDAIVDCDGTSVTITGICGSSTGTADVTTLADLTFDSSTPANNKYCWCKVISPVVTKWVYRYSYTSNTNCAYSCVRGCANAFLYTESNDITFRTTAYSNLVY